MTRHTHCAQGKPPAPPPGEKPGAPAEDPERLALLDGLKSQIRKGVYRPDVRDLARSLANMMVRDL
jgi:hypothetical protein